VEYSKSAIPRTTQNVASPSPHTQETYQPRPSKSRGREKYRYICGLDGMEFMVSRYGNIVSSVYLYNIENAFVHLDSIFTKILVSGSLARVASYCCRGHNGRLNMAN
jgi:hypothetical protein